MRSADLQIDCLVAGKFEMRPRTTQRWQRLQQVSALGHGLAPFNGCVYDRQSELAELGAARLQGVRAVLEEEDDVRLQRRQVPEAGDPSGRRSGGCTLDHKRGDWHGGEERKEYDARRASSEGSCCWLFLSLQC